ncbi:MAG: methyltransferase domain-containing protein [Eubacteriales bacterium]|nr:methyltransferase domain-containing protein [Eubacteriales bacterium]
MSENILICPVCGKPLENSLEKEKNVRKCVSGHSFDIAKDNYVNLLVRSGTENAGDNKEMALSRKNFLSKDYYKPLADVVGDLLVTADTETVLDICCGEGYYTSQLTKRKKCDFYGFDISKEMVRLAAKRRCGAEFFAANLTDIPVRSCSVDFAFHLFAPFDKYEFYRVMKKGGTLVTVIPGREHLLGLKEVLYENIYYNDESVTDAGEFTLADRIRVRASISIDNKEDIASLFKMTPYYYSTPRSGIEKLERTEKLETPIEFVLLVYKK